MRVLSKHFVPMMSRDKAVFKKALLATCHRTEEGGKIMLMLEKHDAFSCAPLSIKEGKKDAHGDKGKSPRKASISHQERYAWPHRSRIRP